tara:strand:- start:295 stop:951 length:657 start_codon:yes stop_codon:yes gene_type:complete
MDTFTGNIEIDNEILQIILESKNFYTGTNRKLMLKNGHGHYPKKGQISATYGLTRRGQLYPSNECREESPYYGWYYTKTYSENKDLLPIFQEYSDLHLPKNFFWTQIQINRCFETPQHRDAPNQGSSVIVGFGDYTGGKLCINKNGKVFYKDIKNKPTKFNGAKYTHWTSPYSGTRWSIVFFTHHGKAELNRLRKKKNEIKNINNNNNGVSNQTSTEA